jgi:hypothetical protein
MAPGGKFLKTAVFAGPAQVFFPASAWAKCPMCRIALAESGAGVIRGYYWCILILVSIPLIVFAAALYHYFRLKRKCAASG